MYPKQPNHLAQLIDHQAAAGSTLPAYLKEAIERYTQATDELKSVMVDCLPDEILHNCYVVRLTDDEMTLSVHSQTAANHIRYLHTQYLKLLQEQSCSFTQLKQLRVVVTHLPEHLLITTNKPANNTPNSSSKQPPKQVQYALSDETRQTIAHAAHHVICDERLKKSLLKLAMSD